MVRRRIKKIVGWREWVALPELGVKKIKAKIDSGAKTSALHASKVTFAKLGQKEKVLFKIHPRQESLSPKIETEADLLDQRVVKSSHGFTTRRPVIKTKLSIGDESWPIELSLVNRDVMGFRMLIGRQAIRRRFLIDCEHSFLTRKKANKRPG